MPLQKQKTNLYNPLPQFSDSDSDIDIFNAKAGSAKPVTYKRHVSKRKWIKHFMLILLVTLIISLTVYFMWYSKKLSIVHKNNIHYVTVPIECGIVEGKTDIWYEHNDTVKTFSFYSVPYAEPPIGKLRWKPSVALSENICKGKILNKRKDFVKCYQGTEGTEDCLYLNVFTSTLNKSSLLPVFVNIHGGSLLENSYVDSALKFDAQFANEFGVVGVSINYRLNAFGFLTLKELWEEGKSYGNYGIMDQILVLKWIQNNIKNFGGDPNSVVLFGYEAGASSIYGLMMSPSAEGLFNKAITIDGDPVIDETYADLSRTFEMILSNTTCEHKQTKKKIRDCLYSLDSNTIWKLAIGSHLDIWRYPTTIPLYGHHKSLLTNDSIILPYNPIDDVLLVKWKNNRKIPIIIGSTIQRSNVESHLDNNEKSQKDIMTYIEKILNTYPQKFDFSKISELYNTKDDSYENNMNALNTDFLNICRNNRFVDQIMFSAKYVPYRFIIENNSTSEQSLIDKSKAVSALFTSSKQSSKVNINRDFQRTIKDFIHGSDQLNDKETLMFDINGEVTSRNEQYHSKKCMYWNQIMFEGE